MATRNGRLFTAALAVMAALCTVPAQAGLTLEQALARHRALRDIAHGSNSGFAPLATPRDGVAPAIGGPSRDIPYLMAPTLRGRGGARVVDTPVEPSQVNGPTLRMSLSWSEGAEVDGTLDGSALNWPLWLGEAYTSVEPRHWGPGWVGSLILDAAAPALPAVGWRKTDAQAFATPWLAWLGPWNADVFMAELSGHTEPANPLLMGMRLQVRPLPGLELGASRVVQWGGRGRDQSLGSLASALAGRDNTGTGNEPGNQLAGFDFRYSAAAGDGDWAVYGQAIGEDEAGMMPSQWTALAGVEWASRWEGTSYRVFAEWADLVAGRVTGDPHYGSTYRNHIFHQGYTQRGLPLGHAAGGDVRLASIGTLIDAGRVSLMFAAHTGQASPAAQRFTPGASLAGFNAAAALAVPGNGRVGLSFWQWRTGGAPSRALQAWWHTAWQ